jgi:threonine dehydrogenase-like Zn-dependent dehydrogenase
VTDQELRALVREIVARRLAERTVPSGAAEPAIGTATHLGSGGASSHASHDVYVTLVNTGDTCLIEPGVSCNHCEHCRSHGH